MDVHVRGRSLSCTLGTFHRPARSSMARKARRSDTASRNAAARRRNGGPQRTGVDEREGWEDFAQKREWFLSGLWISGELLVSRLCVLVDAAQVIVAAFLTGLLVQGWRRRRARA